MHRKAGALRAPRPMYEIPDPRPGSLKPHARFVPAACVRAGNDHNVFTIGPDIVANDLLSLTQSQRNVMQVGKR